jgi:hypothetical protein
MWKIEFIAPQILDLDGCNWQFVRSGRLSTEKDSSSNQMKAGLMGPKSGSDIVQLTAPYPCR